MEKDGKYYTQVFLEKLNYSSFRVNKRNFGLSGFGSFS